MKLSNTSDDGWWMVVTTVRPLAARFFRICTTWNAANESRPDV